MIEEFREFTYNGVTYKVSNLGRVFGKRGELKQRLNSDGYCQVTLGSGGGTRKYRGKNRRVFRVHRLVAICFIPNPENLPDVNHIDYDRTNNRVSNLEWLSHSENVRHSSKTGKYSESKVGINNGRATYTKEEVVSIREMYDSGMKVMDIVKVIHPNFVYKQRKNVWSKIDDIVKRKSFTNVD